MEPLGIGSSVIVVQTITGPNKTKKKREKNQCNPVKKVIFLVVQVGGL